MGFETQLKGEACPFSGAEGSMGGQSEEGVHLEGYSPPWNLGAYMVVVGAPAVGCWDPSGVRKAFV